MVFDKQVFQIMNFNDLPIENPDQDQFGFTPFAKALSDCINTIPDPIGSVVAIYGPWGSGKSSAINLVRHHLKISSHDIGVISFPCWHYRTEDALAVGFFKELYAGLEPGLSRSKKAKEAFVKLGAHAASAGNLLGPILGATVSPLAGVFTKSATSILEGFIQSDTGAEALQKQVSEALKNQAQRFLVIIDDLDRLSPEEALVVFRLVKSVGRLPNVCYLLAYDRDVLEKAVTERYPSEGAHYLEKIVQAGFELPKPESSQLHAMLSENFDRIFSDTEPPDQVHFGNLFHEAIAPEMTTPRDVLRLSNILATTWGAVRGEVDIPDFIALETLRLFRPKLYQSIRNNKGLLVGTASNDANYSQNNAETEYNQIFINNEPEKDRDRLRRAMMRLFPRLQGIWSNTHYSDTQPWSRQRRACAEEHFDTYFRFSLSSQTVSRREIDEIISRATDSEFVQKTFENALSVIQTNGRTKASSLLDELKIRSGDIPDEKVEPLLSSLFAIADKLHNSADERRGFERSDNFFRLHWLLRALTNERFTIEKRSAVLVAALENATLGWLVDLSLFAHNEYYPAKNEHPQPPENFLMTEPDTQKMREYTLKRIREAHTDGTLIHKDNLEYILYVWRHMTNDNEKEVRSWCAEIVEENSTLVKLARVFLSKAYSQNIGGFGGLGDLVPEQIDQVKVGNLDRFLDVDHFRERLEEAVDDATLPEADRKDIQRFLDAWDARNQGRG